MWTLGTHKDNKLLAIEVVHFNGCSCIEISNLWNALYRSFNSTQSCQVYISLLEEIPSKEALTWALFSRKELFQAIKKCNNLSSPELDKLSWRHIKMIPQNKDCIFKLIDITDACINLGYWSNYFKTSTMVIIPKPNKLFYDTPKYFCSIVLLNTLGKLFKKMIGERLQFHLISNNFVHQCQLGGLKHRFTTNAGIALTHFIRSEWVKNLSTSTLAFDIAQFFPSLNHQILPLILEKAGFDLKVSSFFKNYLVSRKTIYLWNNFSSPLCNVDVGVGQGSALSPFYLLCIFLQFSTSLKNN